MFLKVFIGVPQTYKVKKKCPNLQWKKREMAYILGIESSCDDTSAAVLKTHRCCPISWQPRRMCIRNLEE